MNHTSRGVTPSGRCGTAGEKPTKRSVETVRLARTVGPERTPAVLSVKKHQTFRPLNADTHSKAFIARQPTGIAKARLRPRLMGESCACRLNTAVVALRPMKVREATLS